MKLERNTNLILIQRLDLADGIAVAQAAELVSRAFLASPIFAGIDTNRYSPDRISTSMRKGMITLLAYRLDSLVGSATFFAPDPNSLCESFRSSPSVGLLGVDPRWEAKRIASALMESLEESAANEDFTQIALSVTRRGLKLRAMYEKRGYEIIEEMHWPGVIDPSWIMIKALIAVVKKRPETETG